MLILGRCAGSDEGNCKKNDQRIKCCLKKLLTASVSDSVTLSKHRKCHFRVLNFQSFQGFPSRLAFLVLDYPPNQQTNLPNFIFHLIGSTSYCLVSALTLWEHKIKQSFWLVKAGLRKTLPFILLVQFSVSWVFLIVLVFFALIFLSLLQLCYKIDARSGFSINVFVFCRIFLCLFAGVVVDKLPKVSSTFLCFLYKQKLNKTSMSRTCKFLVSGSRTARWQASE